MFKKTLVCLAVALAVAMVPGMMQADDGTQMPFLRDGTMHRPIPTQNQPAAASNSVKNYRGFFLGVNQLDDGTYYLQTYKTVVLNEKEMRSIDASLYRLSADKTYVCWPDGRITESTTLWWPRILTATPYEIVERSSPVILPWGSVLKYTQFVWASLDPGYEFVAANKFYSEAQAISFGKKFVNYVLDMKI